MREIHDLNDGDHAAPSPLLNRTLLFSTLLHLLLGAILWLVHLDQTVQTSEWVEIAFQPVRPTKVATISRGAIVPPSEPATVSKPVQLEPEPEPQRINLPARRMLENEPPELNAPESKKLTPDEDAGLLTLKPNRSIDEPVAEKTVQDDSKTNPGLPEAPVQSDEKQRPTSLGDLGKKIDLPFTIEGEAADRLVLHQVIPKFPEGVQQEATVKIRFTIEPDGRVGTAIPVLKGEAILEKVALEAFRQWRFNALPAGMEQRVASGVITFRFILK